jgi:hypothetical protein
MTLYGKMTRSKVVYADQIYNFIVDIFIETIYDRNVLFEVFIFCEMSKQTRMDKQPKPKL